MDVMTLLGIILRSIWSVIAGIGWLFIPILFFMVVVAFLKSPWGKGIVGEFIVNVSARFLLDAKAYHLIKNVTLPTEDGTTQIDHIIVSRHGVFVVETKNMKGWIFGSEKNSNWTQQIYRHRNSFQNPLRQNHKHVKTLQELLGLADEQMHSLIVFVGDSTFKTTMPDNVTAGFGYIRYIKSCQDVVLSEEEVAAIVQTITENRLRPSWQTNREHVRHVQQIVADKDARHDCDLDELDAHWDAAKAAERDA